VETTPLTGFEDGKVDFCLFFSFLFQETLENHQRETGTYLIKFRPMWELQYECGSHRQRLKEIRDLKVS
jgi:hypothetical protein